MSAKPDPSAQASGANPSGGLALSLVIPVYNEAENIAAVAAEAVTVLRGLGRPFEVLFVNDCSSDATSDEIARAHERWPECRELPLPEHGGQAVALLTGLHAARAPLIATMDGDGQNDPQDLPALLALVEAGKCDFACGWRVDRHDSVARKVMSRIANFVRGAILRDGVHDSGCQLRVFRREIVGALQPMELLQSFIPALVVAAGYRVAEKPVKHHARRGGRSKYGLHNLWWRPGMAMLALRWRLWRRKG
jgi:glycosyltransferase involved in cell wall biosynthesis